jgi:long-subunit acyl-CoA synthetase (AMP-forming)
MNSKDYLLVDRHTFKSLAQPDGRYLHWVTGLDEEVPIQMKRSGYGSEAPLTLIQALQEAADLEPQQVALRIKRQGRWVSCTYAEYIELTHRFARALASLGIGSRKCINICGFNTPEWVISYIGAATADCVPVGVYTTSTSDAVQYIADHSEAELVVVQNEEKLLTYLQVVHNLPKIKAFVVMQPNSDLQQEGNPLILSWDQFMSRGSLDFEGEIERRKQLVSPGRVLTIVYTSGTTGPPKGVLLSHYNFVWSSSLITKLQG